MYACGKQQHFSTKDRKNDSGKVESTIVQSLINLCTKWLITTHQNVGFTILNFQCRKCYFVSDVTGTEKGVTHCKIFAVV
jgi:hypothetical protein